MTKGPKWRPFTWVILVVNILFLVWIISGVSGTSDNCSGLSGQALETCQAGTAVGTGIGVIVIIFLWALVDVILGVLWLITRSKKRQCPVCGNDVKKGLTACGNCGHDFRAGVVGQPPPPPPPPSG